VSFLTRRRPSSLAASAFEYLVPFTATGWAPILCDRAERFLSCVGIATMPRVAVLDLRQERTPWQCGECCAPARA
jgi:hypothetical protein